jgi:hypothetical protein
VEKDRQAGIIDIFTCPLLLPIRSSCFQNRAPFFHNGMTSESDWANKNRLFPKHKAAKHQRIFGHLMKFDFKVKTTVNNTNMRS